MKNKLHLILLAVLLWGGIFISTAPTAMATVPEGEASSVKSVVTNPDDDLPFLEFQFSPIFSYAFGDIESMGYGVQGAIFPTESIGVQLGYTYFGNADTDATSSRSDYNSLEASIIYRLPDKTVEPYFLVGGGALIGGDTRATLHIGAGLNYWINDRAGLFVEARYTWVNASTGDPTAFGDYPSVAIGGRWSF